MTAPSLTNPGTLSDRLRAFFPRVYAEYGPLVARQYMYRAEAAGLVEKSHKTDVRCNAISMELRESEVLPWEAVLDASRKWNPREVGHPGAPLAWLGGELDTLDGIESSYRIPIWATQETIPVVVTEKEGLLPYFERVTGRFGVTVYAIKGQVGQSHFRLKFLPWVEEVLSLGKRVRVFYIGDYDDDGFQIERTFNETLVECGVDLQTERLALTARLVSRHKLTLFRGNPKSHVYRKFIPSGLKAECEALDPKELSRLIERAIKECIEDDREAQREEEEEEARDTIREAARPVLDSIEKAGGSR